MGATTIGDLVRSNALAMGDGYRTKRSEHGQPGFRILRVADVAEGAVSMTGSDFVSADYARQIGPKLAEPGDIILTTKGTVGRVARMPEGLEPAVYSPQVCYFRVYDRSTIDPRYFEMWLRSDDFRRQAANRANNSDMAPYINLADVRSLQLSLPPIGEQRAIAEVLGALDDKIAANTKLVATAIRLADTIFAKLASGVAFGTSTFDDVATVLGGGTPSTKVAEYWGNQHCWATPTDVTGLTSPYLEATSRMISDAGLQACSSVLHPVGSILMTSRATIGAFALAGVPTAVNQGFIVVNARDPRHQWWLFHEMRSRVPEFLSHANGATFLELSRGRFKHLPVRMIGDEELARFNDQVGGLHGCARSVSTESRSLTNTRDALLPLLMSGKLRVKDAERVVEEAV